MGFASTAAPLYLIDPATRVGAITRTSNLEEVTRHYGSENVKAVDLDIGEGMTLPGTLLFDGTENKVKIFWSKTGTPDTVVISGAESEWHTADGLRVGSSAEQVEKANAQAFTLTGFGWDYPGRVIDWEGGRLPRELMLVFDATAPVSAAEEQQVMGDKDFSSAHPVMKKKKLVVQEIRIRWD